MACDYSRCDSRTELLQILTLQKENLAANVDEKERSTEGFLTVVHNFELLDQMNEKCAHILAKEEDVLAGYALCMHPEFADEIPVLKPMFEKLVSLLDESIRYIVMGQICVSKTYRKQGIFRGLYNFMRSELNTQYDSIITEVDSENNRSLQAHYAVGFTDLLVYNSGGRQWHLIRWEI